MKRWNILMGTVVVGAVAMSPSAVVFAAETAEFTVGGLTVERVVDPLGVDDPAPLLGWMLDASTPGAEQSAYEVEVSTQANFDDLVWDSGKVESSKSYDVVYGGSSLQSQTEYHWRVRAWDGEGVISGWSDVGVFETAFLDPDDFGGEWIGSPNRAPQAGLDDANWIWHSGDPDTVPPGERYFRAEVEISSASEVTLAQMQMTADDSFVLYVNGEEVLASGTEADAWRTVRVTDIASYLHDGTNTLAVEVTNAGGPLGVGGAAGLLGRLHIEVKDGSAVDSRTDSSWRSSDVATSGWEAEEFDDSEWTASKIVAAYGEGPWGTSASAPTPPEPLLRRDFDVDRTVASARAYVSGLGYYKLYLNGARVGNHELDPGFTVYDETTLYATYDVTDALMEGDNAIGVSLGRGYFGQKQPNEWVTSAWHDDTKLKLELLITYTDGSEQRVVSDTEWTAADGPTTSESVWFGETYDARLEQPGWNDVNFDDSAWKPAVRVDAPGGTLRSQLFPAIEVTEDIPVVDVTEPVPGTFIYDFGRPTAGWAQVALTGPEGARVDMKYGEKLHDDGTVNNDNVYFTVQDYAYVLKGDAVEKFQPSYSYAGFRYFQVTVPDGVKIDEVLGMRVHSAVERTGDFESSSDLLSAYDDAQADTILNNLHSIPTDTPMYEKRAYGADGFLMAGSAIALFDMQNFFGNWMNTHRDDQTAEGTFGNTVPGSVGSKDQPDPVWSSSYVAISWDLYQAYGDVRVLEDNYDGLTLWMDHYADEIASTGGIYTGFSYGDWLSPAGASPPEGTSLIATAYLYEGAMTMSKIATVLGRDDDAGRFDVLAQEISASFNAAFYDEAEGAYFDDPAAGYRQSSNAVPLSFGLVPEEQKSTVLNNLVSDIQDRDDHLNTGAIGTKELLPVLSQNGYADLAYKVATNPTYPGWGYWFTELGATTMWEEWGAESRSHNHAFLGTVVDWMYEDVAGIEATAPGYSGIRVQPHAMEGLNSAEAHVDSPLGTVRSTWTRDDEEFVLDVSVPVGATAEVHVPVRAGDAVTVTPDVATVSAASETGFAVYTVGSGDYRFIASKATDPTDPTDPTEPTDPTDPTDPGTPGNPEQPNDGTGDGDLAITGGEATALIVLALALVALGAMAFFRRRTRQQS